MEQPTLFNDFIDTDGAVHPELLKGALDALLYAFMNDASVTPAQQDLLFRLKSQTHILLSNF